MKKKLCNAVKFLSLVLIIIMMASLFAGCDKNIKVSVYDYGNKEEITAKVGDTIRDILKDYKLATKDEANPKLDSKLTEDCKEITILRYAKVNVISKAKATEVELVGKTVKDAVVAAGLDSNVETDLNKDTFIETGMNILTGKTLEIKLKTDKEEIDYRTTATNGKELREEMLITKPIKYDFEISTDNKTKLKDGDVIKVYKATYEEKTVKEKIDFETEEQYSDSMNAGETSITQEGVEGEKSVTYLIKYVNGKETSREKLEEKIIKKPVKQIVVNGTKEQEGNDDSDDGGKTEVSRVPVYDCDGSGHGYYDITYSDGSHSYEEF